MPSWAKDPSIGNRMINARMETVAEKPAYRKAFATRRALLPADGYFEWYPTSQTNAKGKPVKQPFFIRPQDGGVLAMAGLYEIWRDPTKAEDDPDRFRWTCTVLTTEAEDSLGHIHDRMPLMVERDRWHEWLDPTTPGDTSLLVPAAPGRLEAYAVPTLVSNVRNNGPELVEPPGGDLMKKATVRTRRHAPRRGPPAHAPRHQPDRDAAAQPRRRRRHRVPRPVGAGRRAARAGRLGGALRAAVAGGRPQGRDRPADPRRRAHPRRRRDARAYAPRRGRPLGRCPLRGSYGAGAGGDRLPGPVLPAAPAREDRADPAPRAAGGRACRPSSCRASATRWAGPRSSPATSTDLDMVVIPGGDHGLKVPARGEVSQDEAMGIVVESTLEWLVREVVGNPRTG